MRCQSVARAEGASLGHGGRGLLGKLGVIREEETWCCRRRNAVSKRARMDGDDDDDDDKVMMGAPSAFRGAVETRSCSCTLPRHVCNSNTEALQGRNAV